MFNFFARRAFARNVRRKLDNLWSGFDKPTVHELFKDYGVNTAILQQYDTGSRHAGDTAIGVSVIIVARFIELLSECERDALRNNPTAPPFGMAITTMEIMGSEIASEALSFRLHAEIDGRLRGLSEYQIGEEYKRFLWGRAIRQRQENERDGAP